MKKLTVCAIVALFAPMALAADQTSTDDLMPPAPMLRIPQPTVSYHITSQILSADNIVIHKGQARAWAGSVMPVSKEIQTPYITGFNRKYNIDPNTGENLLSEISISRGVLKTGFLYSVICSPIGENGIEKVTCAVDGRIAENTQPQLTTPEAQDTLEKEIKRGSYVLTTPSIEQVVWRQIVTVVPGEEAVITAGKYLFKLKVQPS